MIRGLVLPQVNMVGPKPEGSRGGLGFPIAHVSLKPVVGLQ